MDVANTTLRETVVPKTAQASVLRKKANPIRIFVDRDRLAWFWFLAALLVLIGAAVERFYLVESFKQRERVVIVDPAGTFYVSPLLKFEEAKELHVQQTTLAALAFLERNPNGFDHEDWLKQMFLKNALAKAQNLRNGEEAEFKAKQLHQKAEIGRIDILNTRENDVLVQVAGQLVRSGIFQDKTFAEAIPFKLSLKFQRNPDMARNGRFPMAVTDFKYEPGH